MAEITELPKNIGYFRIEQPLDGGGEERKEGERLQRGVGLSGMGSSYWEWFLLGVSCLGKKETVRTTTTTATQQHRNVQQTVPVPRSCLGKKGPLLQLPAQQPSVLLDPKETPMGSTTHLYRHQSERPVPVISGRLARQRCTSDPLK